jgi:hypothetical protein
MNRLEILVLDRRNGIISAEFVDVPTLMSFLIRTGRARQLQLVVRNGNKTLYVEKLDMTTLQHDLLEFQTKQ